MGEEVEKLINDVQSLVARMHTREKRFETFRQQICHVQKQLNCMRQYQEDMLSFDELSSRLNKHPKGQLILCLAVENKQLEQLRMQNRVLHNSLEEYEAVFDLIMSKYREQITGLMHANQMETYAQSIANPDIEPFNNQRFPFSSSRKDGTFLSADLPSSISGGLDNEMDSQSPAISLKMTALASLAREVSDLSDAHVTELERELQRLRTENAGLRDVLAISRAHTMAIGADASVSEALKTTRSTPMNETDIGSNVSSSGINLVQSIPKQHQSLSNDGMYCFELDDRSVEGGCRFIDRSEIEEEEEEEENELRSLDDYSRIVHYS